MGELSFAVLLVDDEPDGLEALATLLNVQGAAQVRAPGDVSLADLDQADLLLVDYRLTEWLAGLALQPTYVPMNGVALAAALKSRSRSAERTRPLGIAIHTGHIEDLGEEIPLEIREHAIARGLDLEWVFAKDGRKTEELVLGIASLAGAIRSLPAVWRESDSEAQAQRLLGLGESGWRERAWLDVQICRAPIHELAAGSHGLIFARWLLHRILPYPTFLLDERQLAARLRIQPESVSAALVKLPEAFQSVSYEGILGGFLGHRWWRAGLEALLWEGTKGQSDNPSEVFRIAVRELGEGLEPVTFANPVVVLNEDFSSSEKLAAAIGCVRLQPDDWPPYADQAWGLIDTVRGSALLRQITMEQDKSLL